jgi:hypothetical protein
MRIHKEAMFGSLPPEWVEGLLPTIQARVEASGLKVVVLDDDPTGTQTVYDVPVLTEWSQPSLEAVLAEPGAIVYILANSRSVPLAQARAMNREIVVNLRPAGRATGRDFVVVSRSDSTLRGHYPGEAEAPAEGLGQIIQSLISLERSVFWTVSRRWPTSRTRSICPVTTISWPITSSWSKIGIDTGNPFV